MQLVVAILISMVMLCGSAGAQAVPKGFEIHKFNGSGKPSYKDGVVSFTINDRQCSKVDYGDGRGETDCKNGNVRSTLRYLYDTKLGETVEYRFDLRVEPSFAYAGHMDKAAQGYYPDGWNSALRVASWEGPFIHNFIYMLKVDTRNGVSFLARQCQKPDDFGKWVRFSMKIRWSSGDNGWIRVSCDGRTIYAAEGIATNQSPHCWLGNECEPWHDRNPKSFNFIVGPVMQGWGPDFAKNGHTSQFSEIQKSGITLHMKEFAISKNPTAYTEKEIESVKTLQGKLKELGCFEGSVDGIVTKLTREAALSCRSFADKEMPEEFNVLTLPRFSILYANSGAGAIPKSATAKQKMPKAKLKIAIAEEVAVNAGDSLLIKSFFYGTIKGQKKGQNELYFAIRGGYNKKATDFTAFNLIIVAPLEAKELAALYKCGGTTEVFIEGTRHAEIPFKRVGNGFESAVSLECLSKALPKDALRQAKFLFANFQDVAVNLANSGKLKLVRHNGLKAILERIALGEIVISGS